MLRLSSFSLLVGGLALIPSLATAQSISPADVFADGLFAVFPTDGPLWGAWGMSVSVDPDAEPEPIATDRPDFTEASSTVGKGVVQLESGYTFSRGPNDESRGHSWGEPLLRVGVGADWLELRLALAPTTQLTRKAGGGFTSTSGAEDLYLGLKLGMSAQSEWLPELAIVPQMTVPTGHSALTADRVLPGCNVLYGWDIDDTWSTAGSTQYNRAVDGDETYGEWAQSWTIGYAVAENVGFYSEWFAIMPERSADAATQHYLNGGLTWRPNIDTQFDIRVGTGLNSAADDLFLGVGASFRFR